MPMVIEAMIILGVLIGFHRMILYAMSHRRPVKHETPAKLIPGKHKEHFRKQRA